MNDKKYMPFKIAHLVLMTLTIVITLVGMIQMTKKFGGGSDVAVIIRLLSSVVRIMAMFVGILYLVKGYKKSSAVYYKMFFWLMMVALVFRFIVFITRKENNYNYIEGIRYVYIL